MKSAREFQIVIPAVSGQCQAWEQDPECIQRRVRCERPASVVVAFIGRKRRTSRRRCDLHILKEPGFKKDWVSVLVEACRDEEGEAPGEGSELEVHD